MMSMSKHYGSIYFRRKTTILLYSFKYKYKYNSYFYCAPYSLTDGAHE